MNGGLAVLLGVSTASMSILPGGVEGQPEILEGFTTKDDAFGGIATARLAKSTAGLRINT